MFGGIERLTNVALPFANHITVIDVIRWSESLLIIVIHTITG
jgi:hypothetical protein